MMTFLSKIANIFSGEDNNKYNNELEQFIVDNNPATPADIDHLERVYNERRFTDMGRCEYFPVTR